MTVSVVLADDHQIVRDGLRALLRAVPEFELIGEAADGRQALKLVADLRPDVLVADLMMPRLGGFEVTRNVRRRHPKTRVVVLSMHADVPYVLEALRAGAIGYVLKDAGADELIAAIRAAAGNQRYLSPPLSESALGDYTRRDQGPPTDPFETLTAREREVLRLTADGHSGASVAEQLFISPRTVETHRANIMRKLNVKNQKELIRYAVQRGLPVEGN